jgi:uncharacterized RDD family membrane protein YckC
MRCIGCESFVPQNAATCPNCGLTQVSGQGLDEYERIQQAYQEEKQELDGPGFRDVVDDDEVADIGDRVAAAFIDAVLIVAAGVGLTYANGYELRDIQGDTQKLAVIWLQTQAVAFLYGWFMTVSPLRGTFGKKAMSTIVVDRHGDRVGFVRGFFRELCKWTVSTYFLFLGYIMAGFDPMGQALHDKICGTYVIDDVN